MDSSATPGPAPLPAAPLTPRTEAGPTARERRARNASLSLLFIYVAAVLVTLQFVNPDLYDTDSYYHARFANLLPWMGLSRGFRWTQSSLWKQHFADKEFLFHAFLAPFCGSTNDERVVWGAKVATAALGIAVFFAFYRAAARLGLRWPGLWTFLLLSAGNHFLFRMLEVRAHLLSVLLVLLAVPWILEERPGPLFLLGFVYAWSYAAPQFLPCLVAVHGAARWAGGAAFPTRALAAAAGGVLAGLAAHPYTPDVFEVWFVQNVQVLRHAWEVDGVAPVRAGLELEPVETRSLVVSSGGVLLAWLGGLAAVVFARKQPSPRTASLAALSAACFVLYLLSAKFVEYFAPFACLFGASAVEDLDGGKPALFPFRGRQRAATAALAALVLLGWTHVRCLRDTSLAVAAYPPPALAPTATWLRDHVPADAVVMNLYWNDFPVLFFHDSRHAYLCGLDPNYQWAVDPGGAALLEALRRSAGTFDPRRLAAHFGARFGVLNLQLAAHRAIAGRIRTGTLGARIVFEDGTGVVFEVDP
ncbi:MAG: hypothetical protein HYZ53_18720 [Planctomycetes bacterium]|nr:hypothetical protein [Planctomycetota bacterium]